MSRYSFSSSSNTGRLMLHGACSIYSMSYMNFGDEYEKVPDNKKKKTKNVIHRTFTLP